MAAAGKQEIEELELAMAEDVVIAEESGRFVLEKSSSCICNR